MCSCSPSLLTLNTTSCAAGFGFTVQLCPVFILQACRAPAVMSSVLQAVCVLQTKSLVHNGDLAEPLVSRVRARGRSEPFDVPQVSDARRWSIRAGLRTGQSRRTDIETWNFESVEHTVDVFQRWSYPVVLGDCLTNRGSANKDVRCL